MAAGGNLIYTYQTNAIHMASTDNRPITKKDWHELVAVIQQAFASFHGEIKKEIKEEVSASEKRLQDSNAAIAKEISDMRAEQAAILGGRMRVNDALSAHGEQLREHERRIGRLELAGE